MSHYDVNDKPCYIKGNYSISRVKYNSNDCIIEQSVYDINDRPCIETIMGSHIICTAYDTYNYLTDVLKVIDAEKIKIGMSGTLAPIDFQLDNFRYIVTPVRRSRNENY